MSDKITEYAVAHFKTLPEKTAVVERLLHYLSSPTGVAWMQGEGNHRAVVWAEGFLSSRFTLYLSSGAMAAAAAAGIPLTADRLVPARDLPSPRSLVVGLNDDWHE